MSIITKKPETGSNDEILFSINIFDDNGKIKVELDEDGNIKTNINGLINEIITYHHKGKIIKVDHDLYNKLNNGIHPISGGIRDDIKDILEEYYFS